MAANSTISGGDTSACDGEFGSKILCVPAMILGGVNADDRSLLSKRNPSYLYFLGDDFAHPSSPTWRSVSQNDNGLLYCHSRPRSIPIFRIFHCQKVPQIERARFDYRKPDVKANLRKV
ncbi:hypothetical protein QTP88_026406 [Uroleucon formosanum]